MSLAIKLVAQPVLTIDFLAISGVYARIGTFESPVRILFVQNLTDEAMMFSFDGVNDHFPLLSNAFLLLDVTTNQALSQGCFMAEGTNIYVKELAVPAGAGAVYVSVFHGYPSY